MTKEYAKKEALRWLDEATVNGQEASKDQIADLYDKFDYFIDNALNFLAGQFKLGAVYSVMQQPATPVYDSGLVLLEPGKSWTMAVPGGKSCWLEISGAVSCTIEESTDDMQASWSPVGEASSEGNNISTYTKNASVSASGLRLRVSPQYSGTIRAVVYSTRWPDEKAIPAPGPLVAYDMPQNFREFDKLVYWPDYNTPTEVKDIRREGRKTFLVPSSWAGRLDFQYWRTPERIGISAADDTELDVDPRAEMLVPLRIAIDATAGSEDTAGISNYLEGKFNNNMANLLGEDDVDGTHFIEKVY